MDDLGLPPRLFASGFEPYGRKRVNSYFTLRWIDILKLALEDDDLAMLGASQFGLILQMGDHTFPVMFMHYLLSRQLVTEKELELWWLLCGYPVRFAIQDFALATGLNCLDSGDHDGDATEKGIGRGRGGSKLKTSMVIWNELFHGEEKPTVTWIMERLVRGKRYKDPLTRLRLSLLVLVEGIICPTSGAMKIRPEVVSMLGNIEEFIKYPWGRESFLMTVRSAKGKTPINYVQETMAIQGFSHGMVLVAVAACPSIIIKAGMGDPLEDSSLSSTEIIRRVVERKLIVNPVTAKAVDELGQAYVRSFVASDAEGVVLNQGLGDHMDPAVDNLVSLILEDYPFDPNMWEGGVKADDVKQKQSVESSSDDSDDHQPSGVDRDNPSYGATRQPPAFTPGQSSSQPSHDAPPTGTIPYDVPTLLRRAADAYEERLHPLFEGYILSLKEYFTMEVGNIRTDMQAATTAIRDLENRVSTEFESLRHALKGLGNNPESSPYRATSPYRQTSEFDEGGDGCPPQRVPTPTNTGGSSPVPPDVGCGEAMPNPVFVSPDDPLEGKTPPAEEEADTQVPSEKIGVETKSQQDIPAPTHASHVTQQQSKFGEGSGSIPPQPTPHISSSQGTSTAPGGHIHHTEPKNIPSVSMEDEPAKVKTTNTFPGLSTVVAELLSAAGIPKDIPPPAHIPSKDTVGPSGRTKRETGKAKVSEPVIVPPTPSASVDESDDVEVLEKSDAAGESPLRPVAKKVSWSDASVAQRVATGGRRISKRQHTSPKRYSPSEARVRKDGPKKMTKQSHTSEPTTKRAKKSGLGDSSTIPAKKPLPLCVGGYNAFAPPAPSNKNAFLYRLAQASSSTVLSGSDASMNSLGDLFKCTGVCSTEALDLVVHVIRTRRDRSQNTSRFEFLPPSFNVELLRNYPGFHAIRDKGEFSFSAILQKEFINRPQWFTQVDYIYSPILIKKTHWVGLVFDLKMWAIYVLDSNPACPSEADVKSFITPIAKMLPFLISRYCVTFAPREMQYAPMTISRLELPILLEHPGFLGVASLLLLEMSAAGEAINSISFTEDEVRVAAENYAIAAMAAM